MANEESDEFEKFARGLRGDNNLDQFMSTPEDDIAAKDYGLKEIKTDDREKQRFEDAISRIETGIESLKKEKEPRLNFLNAMDLSKQLDSYLEETENRPALAEKFSNLRKDLFETNPNLALKEKILRSIHEDIKITMRTSDSPIYTYTEEIIDKLFSTKEFNRDSYQNGVKNVRLEKVLIEAIIDAAKNLEMMIKEKDVTPDFIKNTIKGAIETTTLRPNWKYVEGSGKNEAA